MSCANGAKSWFSGARNRLRRLSVNPVDTANDPSRSRIGRLCLTCRSTSTDISLSIDYQRQKGHTMVQLGGVGTNAMDGVASLGLF
jgi:hypothetical protein